MSKMLCRLVRAFIASKSAKLELGERIDRPAGPTD